MKKVLIRQDELYYYKKELFVIGKSYNVNGLDYIKISGKNEYMTGDCSGLRGDCSGLRGDCSRLRGDCYGLTGDCSGLRGDCSSLTGNCSAELKGDCTGVGGDCSGLRGNLDECEITENERKNTIKIKDLVGWR